MHNLHIEATSLQGTRHLAEITTAGADELMTALQRERDEHGRGQRWFPPDASYHTTKNCTVCIDDASPECDGCTSSEIAAEWVKGGHSFILGPHCVSDPDIKSVLVLSNTEAQRLYDELGTDDPTLSGALGLMAMWSGRPGILSLRLIAW